MADAQPDLLASLAGDGRVLELGVGTGRVALPLAARGVRVEGLDASAAMVAQLEAKPGGEAIPVTIGDMRNAPVTGPFSLVYVVFNTLFGLTNQRAQIDCFAAIAELPERDGAFCVGCFVPDLSRLHRNQSLRTLTVDDTTTSIDASTHAPVQQTVASNLITLHDGETVSVRPVRLRYAWPSELDLMAELARLRLDHRFATWDCDPFDASSGSHISIYKSPRT